MKGLKAKDIIFLFIIFIISLFLRFYRIDSTLCLNLDEAAFGYNAYSLLETGKDEYGTSFPLAFKSIGDYKTPLLAYLIIPLIKTLGLNVISVRFWPAFFGSLTVIPFFYIVFLIFKDKFTAHLAALFLAISPWHLQFTKAGFEAGIASFFIVMGVLGFLIAHEGKRIGYLISFMSFAISLYSYFSERLIAPLVLIYLVFYFRKDIIQNLKYVVIAAVVFLLMLLPLVPTLVSSGQKEKIVKTTLFGYQRPEDYLNKIKSEDNNLLFYYLFHTDLFEKTWSVVDRYLNHFSPTFLFSEGVKSDPRQMIWNMGLMYFYDLPLILAGIYYLSKNGKKQRGLIYGWLFIAPLSSVFTRDLVSARRTINMVYPLLILSSSGAVYLFNYIKKVNKKLMLSFVLFAFIFFIYCIGYYLVSYYVLTPNRTFKGPGGWQCGYKELVTYMQRIKDKYPKIVVDTSYQGPYIFFLFYERYNPAKYQKQARLIEEGDNLGEGAGYDNYVFKPIYWPNDRCYSGIVYAGPPDRLPLKDLKEGDVKLLDTIYFKNGEIAWRIIETLKEPTPPCKLE